MLQGGNHSPKTCHIICCPHWWVPVASRVDWLHSYWDRLGPTGHMCGFQMFLVCSFLSNIALGSVTSCERGVSIAWCQTHPLHVLRCGLVLCRGVSLCWSQGANQHCSFVLRIWPFSLKTWYEWSNRDTLRLAENKDPRINASVQTIKNLW